MFTFDVKCSVCQAVIGQAEMEENIPPSPSSMCAACAATAPAPSPSPPAVVESHTGAMNGPVGTDVIIYTLKRNVSISFGGVMATDVTFPTDHPPRAIVKVPAGAVTGPLLVDGDAYGTFTVES